MPISNPHIVSRPYFAQVQNFDVLLMSKSLAKGEGLAAQVPRFPEVKRKISSFLLLAHLLEDKLSPKSI